MSDKIRNLKLNNKICFGIIFLIALISRIFLFAKVPGGINEDEALGAYDAYSILKTGMDIHGFSYPVYLVAWGSGMNALNTYLIIPFVAVFGLKLWVIRLPELIVALLSVFAVYFVGRELYNDRVGLIGSFLLAVSPWHIMLSRWALECNLAPGFLLFGFLFFIKGTKNNKYFLLSALFWGLSLYAYALTWICVPFIALFAFGYALWCKKVKSFKYIVFSGLILFVFALPLLVFLLVDRGSVSEVKTLYFSIPHLVASRAGEISSYNTKYKIRLTLSILFGQKDGTAWNTTPYGTIYHITIVFFIVGALVCTIRTIKSLISRKMEAMSVMLLQVFIALILGSLEDMNINRINIIYIPMILLAAVGIDGICELAGRMTKKQIVQKSVAGSVFVGYMILFICFETYYFNEYKETINRISAPDLQEAMEYANEFEGEIFYDGYISWSKILFFSDTEPQEFRDTIVWYNYPNEYLSAKSFGRYVCLAYMDECKEEGTYIVNKSSPWNEQLNGMDYIRTEKGEFVIYHR